jgi:hypothetical protein
MPLSARRPIAPSGRVQRQRTMKVGLIALDRDRVYARAHMQPRMDAGRRGVRVNPTMEVLMETATEDRLVERAFELARRSASSE